MASKKRSFFLSPLCMFQRSNLDGKLCAFFQFGIWMRRGKERGKVLLMSSLNYETCTGTLLEADNLKNWTRTHLILIPPPAVAQTKPSGFSRHVRSMLQVSPDVESPSPPNPPKKERETTTHLFYFPLPFSKFFAQNQFRSRRGEGRESDGKGKGSGVVTLNFFVTRTLH